MTNEEAIKALKLAKAEVEWNYPMDYQIALDMAIDALKRNEPTRPLDAEDGNGELHEYSEWKACPHCKSVFGYCPPRDEVSYCPKCGQAIDWKEDK